MFYNDKLQEKRASVHNKKILLFSFYFFISQTCGKGFLNSNINYCTSKQDITIFLMKTEYMNLNCDLTLSEQLSYQNTYLSQISLIEEYQNTRRSVVGLPGDFGSFCQPDSTESENSDYVLRDKKACVRCAKISIGLESQ